MIAKMRLWPIGLLAVALVGCMGIKFEDIDQARTRYQLRDVAKRFEVFNGTYRIGIPDVLNISVPDHPDLSGSYEVRPDGNVSFPLLRDVYVEGLTPVQLSDQLAKELERYVKKVEVLVTVTGMYSKIVFLGSRSMSSLRAYRFTGDMTVADLIAQQGGWTKQDYSSRVRLMRANYEKPEIYRIRLDHIVRGDMTTNVLVMEDDVLYLPATVLAEIGYLCDIITYPMRSIFSASSSIAQVPYGFDYGKEHAKSASSGTY